MVNRLEKHLLNMESVHNAKMKEMVEVLNLWCIDITKISEMFAGFKLPAAQFLVRNSIASKAHDAVSHLKPSDLFIGFTQDTLPSLVYKLCKEEKYQRLPRPPDKPQDQRESHSLHKRSPQRRHRRRRQRGRRRRGRRELVKLNDAKMRAPHFALVERRLAHHCQANYGAAQRDDLRNIVAIHAAFDDLRHELTLFSRFIHTSTHICGGGKGIVALLHASQLPGTVNLCFMAARLVNKRLASEPADAMDKAKWLAWFAQANAASRLIDTFVRSGSCDKRSSDMAEFRALWQRVRVTQSFIEHICLKNDELDVLWKRCVTFWKCFKDGFDLSNHNTLNKLIKWLLPFSKSIHRMLVRETRACEACDQIKFKRLFVNAECSCLVCDKCKRQATDSGVCAKCEKKLERYTFTAYDKRAGVEQYQSFKLSLNAFILDIILASLDTTRLWAAPSATSIDAIIELLMPRTRQEQLNDVEALFDFHLSPSIKSTLFQLLLNYDEGKMESHLDKILSSKYLRECYESDDLANLKLM